MPESLWFWEDERQECLAWEAFYRAYWKGSVMMFHGYMIRFDTWEKAIRESKNGTKQMKERIIATGRLVCDKDGLLDSLELGMALGMLANQMETPVEMLDWRLTTQAGSDLNKVPYVRTPKGSVS